MNLGRLDLLIAGMQPLRLLAVWLLITTAAFAADLRIATLNCLLLFKPGIDHPGRIDNANPITRPQYEEKLTNLLSLVSGAEFVGLQETGGRAEIEDLARSGGYQWAFAKGRDTYTGEEVGALYKLPGWNVVVNGRVASLDLPLSKHLLVTARKDGWTVHFLVVHLIRPIGKQAAKHQRQLDAIASWVRLTHAQEPSSSIVIVGDTNHPDSVPGASIYGAGHEAGELNHYAATHLDGRCFDRLVVFGSATWTAITVKKAPYGKKPNKTLKQVWTDHYAVEAHLHY